MNNQPYLTLMLQFETQKPSAKFIDYIGRESAKEKTYGDYLSYMDRAQSQNFQNQKITQKELIALENNANQKIKQQLQHMKQSKFIKDYSSIKNTGLFTFDSDDLLQSEKNQYKKLFEDKQAEGNILFKDVLSFSTEALIEAGIYNPYTNQLNRKQLIEASRKMMTTMIKEEQLDPNLVFIGAIHYNTKHFHIHFASIEKQNTRVKMELDGKTEFRGKRKPSTSKVMKSTFANAIFDRTHELEKISELRNVLREEVKNELYEKVIQRKNINQQLNDFRDSLPNDLTQWTAKKLNDSNQKKAYRLIDELMSDNQNFQEYKNLAKEEDDFKTQLFGQSNLKGSFYRGRMYGQDGIYYRLSNSVLEEMRNEEKAFQALEKKSKPVDFKLNRTTLNMDKVQQNKRTTHLANEIQYRLNQITHNMNKQLSKDKWKAQKEFEEMQRKAELENQYGGFDL